MSKLVSIQQASANALAAFIKRDLNDSTVKVEPRWPDPKLLPAKAISIIMAGPRVRFYHETQMVKVAAIDASHARYQWVVGNVQQAIQLDVWCLYDIDRDDLNARLDRTLTRGSGYTLGLTGGNAVEASLILPLAQEDGWFGSYCECAFDDGPLLIDSPTNATQTMYRALWKGEVNAVLVVEADSPRMATLKFKERFADVGAYDLQLTVTAQGPSYQSNVP